ncbi:hypothetical protein [Providencia rettgeri]|uniref:hypothetical protein n=1 Tax=Providencia rettgeri TaxID=587 RepID=UPI0023AA5AF7|nr:hypothetical protein [Providencia rettgeri]
MAKLTKKELAWIEKVQKVLNECPSERLGAYTIGDTALWLYDLRKEPAITNLMNECCNNDDFCQAAEKLGANFNYYLRFPFAVESTAG